MREVAGCKEATRSVELLKGTLRTQGSRLDGWTSATSMVASI